MRAGEKSDPYLLWGFDRRMLQLSHGEKHPVKFTIELDLDGTGLWVKFGTSEVKPGTTDVHVLPAEIQAHWIRVSADSDCTATAKLVYDSPPLY